MEITEAYQQGIDDWEDQRPRSANPHTDSFCHSAWDSAWADQDAMYANWEAEE